MKLLFLHTELADCSEYKIHKAFVNRASCPDLDAHFLWQSHVRNTHANCPAQADKPANTRFFDFGRDLSARRAPQRLHRAFVMARQSLPARRFVARAAAQVQPDAVYTAQRVLDMKRAACLTRQHGLPHIAHINYPVGPWLGKGVIPGLQKADVVIVASHFIRRTAEDNGVPSERIQVIYNLVELEEYALPPERRWLEGEFSLPENTLVITIAARLDPSKGHALLFDALPAVLRRCPQTIVLVCGVNSDGSDYAAKLQQQCRQLGIENSIRFAGFRSDMARILSASDLFCLPTQEEAFGLVFTEAMAAGLPVVAVRSGAVPEIVVDGETGLLGPEQDAEQLTRHLLSLLENPALRRRMGDAGRERARSLFAPDILAGQWRDALLTQTSLKARLFE